MENEYELLLLLKTMLKEVEDISKNALESKLELQQINQKLANISLKID